MAEPGEQPAEVTDDADEAASAIDRFFLGLAPWSRHVALLAAWTAMGGSLFFSEVLSWAPCTLCWYQRILMYPLAIVIAVGILRRDAGLHLYVLPLSVLGGCVSVYHYLLIKTDLFTPPSCSIGIPCTVGYLNWLGFVNIPFLALTAFVIISLMMVLSRADAPAADMAEAGIARLGAPDLAVLGIIGLVVGAYVVGGIVARG